MARLPYAMQDLISQVFDVNVNATVNAEEEDGLGVYRQVTFDPATSRWLEPIMRIVAPKDERIRSVVTSRGGMLMVNFVTDSRADDSTPFPIAQVDKVLNGPAKPSAEPDQSDEPDEPDEKPAKKAPAKKEASKAPAKKAAKKK